MINNFIVKAIPEKNMLDVVLDGFFMKSEIELAMHLAKRESLKLRKGYNVRVDLTKFRSNEKRNVLSFERIQQQLKSMGSGNMKFIGANFSLSNIVNETLSVFTHMKMGDFLN
jgi:hypothetical protein